MSLAPAMGELFAQANQFRDLWNKGTDGKLERHFEQAIKSNSEESFQQAVDRGLKILRGDWEAKADRKIEKELSYLGADVDRKKAKEDLEAEKALAYVEWEREVEDEVTSKKGNWKAQNGSLSLDRVWEKFDVVGLSNALLDAENLSKSGSNSTEKLNIWDTTVGNIKGTLRGLWESELDILMNEVKSGEIFSSDLERESYEQELQKIRQYYLAEYEYEESSILSFRRANFISNENKASDLSNQVAQDTNPSELAKLLVERARQQLQQNGAILESPSGSLPSPNIYLENGGDDYQKKILDALESGQKTWQTAIDEMVLAKLKYDRDVELQWRSGEADWMEGYSELVKAREEWMSVIQGQIQEGLANWDTSEVNLVENKAKAVEELNRTLDTERVKWDSHVSGIRDILIVGSDTLSTIASNKVWFSEALQRAQKPGSGYSGAVISEYNTQLAYWSGLEGRYRNLVEANQNQIHDNDIRGNEVGEGILVNAGGSDPYILTVQEFELKLAKEELKLLEAKRDRAETVYNYAIGKIGNKTEVELTAELNTIRSEFQTKESTYLALLSELNGSGSSAFTTVGLDDNSSINTGNTTAPTETILERLERESLVLDEKRKALEVAREAMNDATVAYQSALKIQVLIQNSNMLGQIGNLESDPNPDKEQGNSGLRNEILHANKELEVQREKLRQQEKAMYELQYERENAIRATQFTNETYKRVLEFEQIKENRATVKDILDGDGSLVDKIDELLTGDNLVVLYGNQLAEQIRKQLEGEKEKLNGLDNSANIAIDSYNESTSDLKNKLTNTNTALIYQGIGSVSSYISKYENIFGSMNSSSNIDTGYLSRDAILEGLAYLKELESNLSDTKSMSEDGFANFESALNEYISYRDANVAEKGSVAYSAKMLALEKELSQASYMIDSYRSYATEIGNTTQYLDALTLDAFTKSTALIDSTLVGDERKNTLNFFKDLRAQYVASSNTWEGDFGNSMNAFSGIINSIGGYGASVQSYRATLEEKNGKVKEVSSSLLSLYDGLDLEFDKRKAELDFLLNPAGSKESLKEQQEALEVKSKVAGAEINLRALELFLGQVDNLQEGERDVESIYLSLLRESEIQHQGIKTDHTSTRNRQATDILLAYIQENRGTLDYQLNNSYDDFISELEDQISYAEDVLAFHESGGKLTESEREEIRWDGSIQERRLLAEYNEYGSTLVFGGKAIALTAKEQAVSERFNGFAEGVVSGEILSLIKENYFRSQENKATGILKELRDEIPGFDDITASKLYSDSFIIGEAGDRDPAEETRRKNLLTGYLSGLVTTEEKLNALMNFNHMIEVFGPQDGMTIFNQAVMYQESIQDNEQNLNNFMANLLNPWSNIQTSFPDFINSFSDTNKTSFETLMNGMDSFFALKDWEDTNQPPIMGTDGNGAPIIIGYEKPFAQFDFDDLDSKKEALGELFDGWSAMKEQLNTAFSEYTAALEEWKLFTAGTEEYATKANEVTEKLNALIQARLIAQDYLTELNDQHLTLSEESRSFMVDVREEMGLGNNTYFLTNATLLEANDQGFGIGDAVNSSDPVVSGLFTIYNPMIVLNSGWTVDHVNFIASVELDGIIHNSKSNEANLKIRELSYYGEVLESGLSISNRFLEAYLDRNSVKDASNDFIDGLEDKVIAYAVEASQNQISQEDLISYTKNIKEFLLQKTSKGEEVNSALWEALANVEAFTEELEGLKYYSNLESAKKTDKAQLESEFNTAKASKKALEEANGIFKDLQSKISQMDKSGLPLHLAFTNIESALQKYEELKTKFTSSDYSSARLEEGFNQLKEFAWQTQKDKIAEAFYARGAQGVPLSNFMKDIRDNKFIMRIDGNNRTANFLGKPLTETEISEIESYLTGYDIQLKLQRTENLSKIDDIILTLDEEYRESTKNLSLRQSFERINSQIAQGVFPNISSFPSDMKDYSLFASFEAFASYQATGSLEEKKTQFLLQTGLSSQESDKLTTYLQDRDSKNLSNYLPDLLQEAYLYLDFASRDWTSALDPEDTASLTNWLTTNGYDDGLTASLKKAVRKDHLFKNYSGEKLEEYIASANAKLTGGLSSEETSSLVLFREGLYNPSLPSGIDPNSQVLSSLHERSYTFSTGFSEFANDLGEESEKIQLEIYRKGIDEKNKKYAWNVSRNSIKIESYLSYTSISPDGQTTPSIETQTNNRLRELEFQAEHRLGNFLALLEEYNSFAFDPLKESGNPSLQAIIDELSDNGYEVRDEEYSKNASLEYEFAGTFDNIKAIADNYLKNNLPGRFAIDDPYARVNSYKSGMSSSADSIKTAGEEISVIYNVKNTYGSNYHQHLQAFRANYDYLLSIFNTTESGFSTQQSIVNTIQTEYANKQEEINTAYQSFLQTSNELSLASAVYDYGVLERYSEHNSLNNESSTILSPVDLAKKRYDAAKNEVNAKLAEIKKLQSDVDSQVELNELRSDPAVAQNRNEAEDWANRAMRYSQAEAIIQKKMQDLKANVDAAKSALQGRLGSLLYDGPPANIENALDGRLDVGSSSYKNIENQLRGQYSIAEGVRTNRIGFWDFAHAGRGGSFSSGYNQPIYNFMSRYNGGEVTNTIKQAQDAFNPIFALGNPDQIAQARNSNPNYPGFHNDMEGLFNNSRNAIIWSITIQALWNPFVISYAIQIQNSWDGARGNLNEIVHGDGGGSIQNLSQNLRNAQEELNRYTDISTKEQLTDMLLGRGYYAGLNTGLTEQDVTADLGNGPLLQGNSGELKTSDLVWNGGKDPLTLDRIVGKGGEPVVQRRGVKDSYGLYVREGLNPVGSKSASGNEGYAADGRLMHFMTSADEFVGSLASLAKSQYEIERDEYYAAQEAVVVDGVKVDQREILDDREAFFSTILRNTTQGTGAHIEYDMYKTLVNDYMGQGKVLDQIYDINEKQQREAQLKNWNEKEKDFQNKKQEWVENIQFLQKTGTNRFNDMLTSYNQAWEEWRRDFRKETTNGNKTHMTRIETALKEKAAWEGDLLAKLNSNDQSLTIGQVYNEILKTIDRLGDAPKGINLKNQANAILNNLMSSKPQSFDAKILEQGLYSDVQFYTDQLAKSNYDSSNVEKMNDLRKDMDDKTKRMAVLQTLDSLWSIPLAFEETIAAQNKALDEGLTSRLNQDGFFKVGGAYIRQSVDKLGNPTVQALPTYQFYQYTKPSKLPNVKDASGKEWDLTDFEALSGLNGPTSAELGIMVRLAKNQLSTDFKNTFDPERQENREIGFTLADPKAMSRVARSAQSSLQRLYTDPEQILRFTTANDAGKKQMIESAQNSGYLVGPTVGGSFGTHHFTQYYPILKMKEMYNEQKAEGEALQGDGFANAVGNMAGNYLSFMSYGIIDPKMISGQVTKFMHDNKEVIDTVVEVTAVVAAAAVAVVGAPFTGGASIALGTAILGGLATYKAVQGSYEGGTLGAVAGGISGFSSMTGVSVSYSFDEGFGANVGVETGALSLGMSYSEKSGFGVDASMELGEVFTAGVSYSQNEGFGASIGVSLGEGNNKLNLGASYTQNSGVGGNVGVSNNGGLGKGVTTSGQLTYNKQSGFGVNASVSYKDPNKPNTPNTPNSSQPAANRRPNGMSGTGAKIGYTQNGGFEAGIDVLGANAFNWSETNGLTANTNWAVDYKRAKEREEIEEKKQKKALELAEGKDKFVKDWKEKHPGDAKLSDQEIFDKYSAEKKANGDKKDGSRETIGDHVAGFFKDNFSNFGGSDSQGWVDDKGEFHANTCFVAGTKIHTQTGLKNIEDIQVGDVVLSWNEETGKKEYKTVTELFVHDVELLFEVRIQKALDESLASIVDETILETTWNHPFWVVEKKAWVQVKDLQMGGRVLLSNGKEVAISGIKKYNVEATKVYNIEVADNHTYFVGEDGVLVHNYEVKAGDTLSKIAKKHGLSLDELLKLNPGIDPKKPIQIGQSINTDSSSNSIFLKIDFNDLKDRTIALGEKVVDKAKEFFGFKNSIIGEVDGNRIYDPTNKGVRGRDSQGCGGYDCSRGSRIHNSLDMVSEAGQNVRSPISGTVEAYGPSNNYNAIYLISDDRKVSVQLLYTEHLSNLRPGDRVEGGITVVGTARDITAPPYRYGSGITNHVHMRVEQRGADGVYRRVNPISP